MITVLHRGGYAQMITILHRGGGALGTPKSDYVICARPLMIMMDTLFCILMMALLRHLLQVHFTDPAEPKKDRKLISIADEGG